MSVTDEIMGGAPRGREAAMNRAHMRLTLEVAAVSNLIRLKEGEYDIEGFRSLPPVMQDACLQIARQYMLIVAESMKEEGAVNEKNSAYLYLKGVDGD